MNPERQRLAIAKALGLKLFHEGRTVHGALWASRDGKNWFYCEDWLSDHDALRDVEMILLGLNLLRNYGTALAKLVLKSERALFDEEPKLNGRDWAVLAMMSTIERAETLLRTLNLWEEPAKAPTTALESS
jgi:hypothetical protein